jgi:O-antigen ligase
MRRNLVAGVYAFWLLATEILFYLFSAESGDDPTVLKVAVLLGVLPAAVQILLLGFKRYGLIAPVRLVLVFLLIVAVGYLGNAYQNSLTWFASLVFIFIVSILVAGSPDERLIRSIGVFYSIPAVVFLLYVAFTGEHLWGRLRANGVESDWWGLVGAGLAMSGFAHRSRLLATLCVGVGFYIAYDANARSDMLSIIAGLSAVGLLGIPRLRGSRLVAAFAVLLVLLVLSTLFLSPIIDTVTNVVLETMRLDDPGRGIGTGVTGRTTAWADTFQIWLQSPLFGVGFHQHTMLTPYEAPAHMIYLAMLADTGIFGLIWYTVFLGVSLLAALDISDPRSRNVVVGTIVAYVGIGFFDTHGLGSANPVSLYFEMCCFFALRQSSIQRVAGSVPQIQPVWAGRHLDAM